MLACLGPAPPCGRTFTLHLSIFPHAAPPLPSSCLRSLLAQLAADCSFLEDIHVMDYSLLMGVHCKSFGETSASPLNTDKARGRGGAAGVTMGVRCRCYLKLAHLCSTPGLTTPALNQCLTHCPAQEENEAYLSAEEGPRASTEEAGAEADEEEEEEDGSGDDEPGALQGAERQRRLSIGGASRGRRIGSAGVLRQGQASPKCAVPVCVAALLCSGCTSSSPCCRHSRQPCPSDEAQLVCCLCLQAWRWPPPRTASTMCCTACRARPSSSRRRQVWGWRKVDKARCVGGDDGHDECPLPGWQSSCTMMAALHGCRAADQSFP